MRQKHRIKRIAIYLLSFFFAFISQNALSAPHPMDTSHVHPPIPLLDEAGNHVLESSKPYSSKMTCGTAGCHDYESITHAYHIEQGRDEARDDFGLQRGLSHLVSPGYFGGLNCMGGSNPDILAKKDNDTASDFADLGAPDFIQRCIGCHTGGGWAEKDRNGNRYDEVDTLTVPMLDGDYYSRNTNVVSQDHNNHDTAGIAAWDWKKSGVIENDCLMCHFDFSALKIFDEKLDQESSPKNHFKDLRVDALARQGDFRYVNTAIIEFMNLKHKDGMQNDVSLVSFSRKVAEMGDASGPTLEKDEQGLPILKWNAAAFDEEGKAHIPMLRFPGNANCMNCHRTSNSRRGFYGFGESSKATYDGEDGPLIDDYQDDVHKGKTWIEINGEERNIENCNACHTRNYFNKPFENVDLDANHNFLKGNSDMDVRNDLDYAENAKSCEYCHDKAPAPAKLAIPSGHDSMLSAHRELWKTSGDMAGYPQATLTRITQTHLDIVSCQACHITGKKSRGKPMQIMYRYREAENGDLKIVPYNPRLRYYWKDKNSGRIMTATERNSVFELRTNDEGEKYGAIVDPQSGALLGTVSARLSHGSWRFGEPKDYQAFLNVKMAFDKVLTEKGLKNPNAIMVWTESNQYLMSHNTRPSVASIQCEECHAQKQDGSFSALISTSGLFGKGNIKTITQLPDPRLVAEGLIEFDYPYMVSDPSGKVTENVSDILYLTKIDPSMSLNRAAIADVNSGKLDRISTEEAINRLGINSEHNTSITEELSSREVYLYQSRYGRKEVRNVSLLSEVNGHTKLTFPNYRIQIAIADLTITNNASQLSLGTLSSEVYDLEARNSENQIVTHFSTNRILVKLPYKGQHNSAEKINIIYSSDGNEWSIVPEENIIKVLAHSNKMGIEVDGYVAFWTDHFSYYAVTNKAQNISPPQSASGEPNDESSNSNSGSGAINYGLLLLIGFISLYRLRCHSQFRKRRIS